MSGWSLRYDSALRRTVDQSWFQEAIAAAEEIKSQIYVVKSQIHAGGRGAGHFKGDQKGKGGVRVVTSIAEVEEIFDIGYYTKNVDYIFKKVFRN